MSIDIETIMTGKPSRLLEYTSRQFLIAAGSALLESGYLLLGTLAFMRDSAGFCSLISFMVIVWAFMYDQLVFDQNLDGVSLLGALTIISIAVFITFYKIRAKNQDKK